MLRRQVNKLHLSRRSIHTSTHSMSAAVPRIQTTTPEWSKWRMNPPSAIPVDSVTFRNQSKLPKLPVNDLDVTLDKLVKSCEPLAKDQAEFDAFKAKVEAFRQQDGLGRQLQQRLVDKRAEPSVSGFAAGLVGGAAAELWYSVFTVACVIGLLKTGTRTLTWLIAIPSLST